MVLKGAGGGKEKRAEQLGARSEERGRREASSIWTTFFEASPTATPGLEKRVWGRTGHPLPPLLFLPNEVRTEPSVFPRSQAEHN